MDTILQDLRYGIRMVRRSPAVAVVAILSLGLGIGGAAAVFGLTDALLFRELPVTAPRELAIFRWTSGVSVFESLNGDTQHDHRDFSITSTSFSKPAFEALRRDLSDRAGVFGFADLYRVNLSIDGRADVGSGHVVSGNYYRTLGLSPASGRLISDADDRADAPPVAVISYPFWQRRVTIANKPLAFVPVASNDHRLRAVEPPSRRTPDGVTPTAAPPSDRPSTPDARGRRRQSARRRA